MITVYGIKNCDTCRKALKWMESEGLAHRFHDFRADGLDEKTASGFIRDLGPDFVVNRRSTSWRALDEGARAVFESGDPNAMAGLLVNNPTLIKRPVFDIGEKRINGFGAGQQKLLSQG